MKKNNDVQVGAWIGSLSEEVIQTAQQEVVALENLGRGAEAEGGLLPSTLFK